MQEVDVAGEGAVFVEAGNAHVAHDPIPVVGTAQPILGHKRPSLVERGCVAGQATHNVVRMHACRPPVAQLVLQRATGKRQPGRVDMNASLGRIGHPDQDRRSVGHDPQAFPTFAQHRCLPRRLGRQLLRARERQTQRGGDRAHAETYKGEEPEHDRKARMGHAKEQQRRAQRKKNQAMSRLANVATAAGPKPPSQPAATTAT